MAKYKIEDIIPAKAEFFIAAKGRTFAVRAPTLSDHVWFSDKYDSLEAATKIMASRNWREICRIVYFLFSNEDRKEFLASKAEIVNEEGESSTKFLTGPDVLLTQLSGLDEAAAMLGALTRAICLSNPIIEAAVVEELKKNLANTETSIGEKSSISSKLNTAGRHKKSVAARPVN